MEVLCWQGRRNKTNERMVLYATEDMSSVAGFIHEKMATGNAQLVRQAAAAHALEGLHALALAISGSGHNNTRL